VPGNVLRQILNLIKERPVHMTLIDPDKQAPEQAGVMARAATDGSTDAIMVGGSTGVTKYDFDETIKSIKRETSIPVIIFPTSANALSRFADAIFFMSMLNSQDLRYVMGEQKAGAPVVKKMGLEPISLGYIIVEPGMKVGEVGSAEVIKKDDNESAIGYALAGQYLGMSMIYLEAGSGADSPVPPSMIAAVKDVLQVPLIVGGGIREPEQVRAAVEAGADIIVTGTIVEETSDIENKISSLVAAARGD
jgi:phosphoglycerol geranylgeranyltransferase